MNESVKKSLEKSKNVLEEKRNIVKRKICIKKTHVYDNCYELRLRAIKNLLSVIEPRGIGLIIKILIIHCLGFVLFGDDLKTKLNFPKRTTIKIGFKVNSRRLNANLSY